MSNKVQYVTNDKGKNVSVIVPIALWKELQSELETNYLLSNPVMKKRLLAAKNRKGGVKVTIEELRAKLGI